MSKQKVMAQNNNRPVHLHAGDSERPKLEGAFSSSLYPNMLAREEKV